MSVPQEVLTESLNEAIGKNSVESAVFTTFSFDPGFFESHILPGIFPGQRFSSSEKVRLMQLEEQLRKSTNLEVFYSDIALAPDALSPQLPYTRIAVPWRRGVFHPKLVLLLVKQKGSEFKSLIVCCLSANLTRSGWWENVECCHIEEIHDYRTSQGEKGSSFRTDLIAVLRRIQKSRLSRRDTQIDVIIDFLKKRVNPAKNSNGVDIPIRMFGGYKSKSLAQWLKDTIPEQVRNKQLNMEVISPYFDSAGIDPLERIINVVNPVETRVHLPKQDDGTVLVSENVYNSISNHPKIEWAQLPDKFISRMGADSNLLPRFVHAKVYRLWHSRKKCPNIFIIGSVNCTSAATGEYKNMEVAILVDKSDDSQQFQREWLLAIDDEQCSVRFLKDVPDEHDGLEQPQGDISIRFDWQTNALEVVPSLKSLKNKALLPLKIQTPSGKTLFEVNDWDDGCWKASKSLAKQFRDELSVSSLLRIDSSKGGWLVLVEESGFEYRPSISRTLTPAEILEFWSLLSPVQRTLYLERRMMKSEIVEGIKVAKYQKSSDSIDSVFAQFSGIFHAFGRLRRHLRSCFENNHVQEAVTLLLGQKYDSMPVLLEQILSDKSSEPLHEFDSLHAYITFLTAKQLRDEFCDNEQALATHQNQAKILDQQISQGLSKYRQKLQTKLDSKEFLDWFDKQFLAPIGSED